MDKPFPITSLQAEELVRLAAANGTTVDKELEDFLAVDPAPLHKRLSTEQKIILGAALVLARPLQAQLGSRLHTPTGGRDPRKNIEEAKARPSTIEDFLDDCATMGVPSERVIGVAVELQKVVDEVKGWIESGTTNGNKIISMLTHDARVSDDSRALLSQGKKSKLWQSIILNTAKTEITYEAAADTAPNFAIESSENRSATRDMTTIHK